MVIDDLREVKGVKQKIEELIYHDARGVQKSNMDIDGIQNQIMDYEILLNKITDLTNEKSAQIERHWNDQIFTQIHTQKNEVKDDKDNEIIFQLYEQKISKLEIDLKREKELRQVKYYRSDKKTTEINSLRKEKDELVNRCKKYQNFIKELEAQNMIALHENQQISCNLHLKVSE